MIHPEINDADLAEIAKQITEGYTSGINDDGQYRTTWEIKMEKFCTECNGTGEVTTMERVYPDAGSPSAPIGTEKCRCQIRDEDESNDQD